MSPLAEIAEVMGRFPEVMFIVDTVSSMSALKVPVDELGIDSCIFGVQKAFALPPGLTVFTASEKALQRAAGMEGRGYYFDYLEFAANDAKDNTPSTPCISLIYALDRQLERIFAEGLENSLGTGTPIWLIMFGDGSPVAASSSFPKRRYCSQTLTCSRNSRGIDLASLKRKLAEAGFAFDDGYGKIKGQTFRIAHMGDMTRADLDELLSAITTIMPELA